MKLVTRAFADWCQAHNIPLDKVELIVRSHDVRTSVHVRSVVGREFAETLFPRPRYSSAVDGPMEINGVRVNFTKDPP
jgi:hypothetical protein